MIARADDPIVEFAMHLVMTELQSATRTNGAFHSAHEGAAVIKEEYDELWDEVRKKERDRDPTALVKEAKQVAAMGLRFLIDVSIPALLKDHSKFTITTEGNIRLEKSGGA